MKGVSETANDSVLEVIEVPKYFGFGVSCDQVWIRSSGKDEVFLPWHLD